MAQNQNHTDLQKLLLQCITRPDPMLSLPKWLCEQLMETEVAGLTGAEKNPHSASRKDYRCGYRPRRFDTRMGTMYLMVPKLRGRGLAADANRGLIAAIRESVPGCSWQRCKVHFMRSTLAHVPQKAKGSFAAERKEIWLAPRKALAQERANALCDRYDTRFPKAVETLENGDSLAYYAYPDLDARKISSTNILERRNKKIRRRTNPVGIFQASYLRLVTTYLMEYAEDWLTAKFYINSATIAAIVRLAAA